jgi:uridine kinase
MPAPRPTDVGALAARVRAAATALGAVRLICVDGPAGSGKTTLAGVLATALGQRAAVVHLDDLYEGWTGLVGVWERVEAQLLVPLAAGRSGRYQRYDWPTARFAEWVEVPVPEVLILEGCGSSPRAVDGRAVLRVFVDAPADVRLARGLARDGADERDHWLAWMAEEATEFVRESTRDRADVVVDGTAPLAP